jgi:hypothetical protein
MSDLRISVFEDDAKHFSILETKLRAILGDDFKIELYDGSRPQPKTHGEVEEWVRSFLLSSSPATLAMLDWDLTAFVHFAPQQFVRGIAEDLAIPVVMYQGADPKNKALEKLKRWQEKRIAIEGTADHEKVASKCADVAKGFSEIYRRVSALGDAPRLLETLREVLKPPSEAPLHLETFAVGSQELLSVVGRGFSDDQHRFLSTWMGYLIHNRILQFPGPILGRVAAAAYLAMDLADFDCADTQKMIEGARYNGPFSESLPGWWLAEIDRTIASVMRDDDGSVPLGWKAFARELDKPLKPGHCIQGHALDEPGYLCVLKDAAVCAEHSQAPDAWIPRGADRCRIYNDEFELLQAYLGL